MSAITFKSEVKDNVIKIPEQYKDLLTSTVVVTIRPTNEEGPIIYPPRNTGLISEANFQAAKIDTRNFVFNRDEANER
ncbi:hypothetical protein AGMMS49942_28740 [Spirochaetia bacterium]|nr:hypothetical protein AGMMS49942_28740 [Spirochaetia bacterium]